MPGFNITGTGDGPSATAEIKRAHRWLIEKFGSTLVRNDLIFAKSVTMPSIGFADAKVLGGSISYKFATQPEFGDLTVAFYDLKGLEPRIRQWQGKVWSPATGIGQANEYKDEVILALVDGKGETVDDPWHFINAWPKIINHGELLYDSSEFKLLTVVVSYDYILYGSSGVGDAAAFAGEQRQQTRAQVRAIESSITATLRQAQQATQQ